MKNIETPNIEEIVSEICNAKSPPEALETYLSAEKWIRDWRFVIASPKGADLGFSVNKNFAHGAAVRSLFKTEKILVLDPVTVHDTLVNGHGDFPFDYSISLDTQALSHLKPFVAGRDPVKIDPDLNEVFEFIAKDNVYVDPIPFFAENFDYLDKSPKAIDDIFEWLKAYEVLRTLDKPRFLETGEAHSILPPVELVKRAQETVSRMLFDRNDHAAMDALRFHHAFEYAHLLKMASIAFRYPKANVDDKMELFAEFGDQTLATIGARETVLARAYFERGQNMGFFGRIQKKKPDLFKVLKNMAWDLCHARRMELGLTLRPSRESRYFFPALLTFDKDLIEVLDLYPLKACAFREGTFQPMPFYDGDWEKIFSTTHENFAIFMERFYSDTARTSREIRRFGIRKDFLRILKKLEDELTTAAQL